MLSHGPSLCTASASPLLRAALSSTKAPQQCSGESRSCFLLGKEPENQHRIISLRSADLGEQVVSQKREVFAFEAMLNVDFFIQLGSFLELLSISLAGDGNNSAGENPVSNLATRHRQIMH